MSKFGRKLAHGTHMILRNCHVRLRDHVWTALAQSSHCAHVLIVDADRLAERCAPCLRAAYLDLRRDTEVDEPVTTQLCVYIPRQRRRQVSPEDELRATNTLNHKHVCLQVVLVQVQASALVKV